MEGHQRVAEEREEMRRINDEDLWYLILMFQRHEPRSTLELAAFLAFVELQSWRSGSKPDSKQEEPMLKHDK